MATLEFLPLDLITEILARLPVKSLLQFRCVCKSWCSLISGSQFVKKHLALSTINCESNSFTTPKRMIQCGRKVITFYSLQSSISNQRSIDVFIEEADYPRRDDQKICFDVVGSCDGLVCGVQIYGYNIDRIKSLFLWNPCTMDCKILPLDYAVELKQLWRYGFGYDYGGDDYKVVITLVENLDVTTSKSMIYTLRTNSWRSLDSNYPFDNSIKARRGKPAIFVRGALYWSDYGSSRVIVSFDLTSETYMEVPEPKYGHNHTYLLELGASRGNLCVLVYYFSPEQYEIWVMKEYSWTKSLTIQAWLFPTGLSSLKLVTWSFVEDEILLNISGKFASYNAKNKMFKMLAPYDAKEKGKENPLLIATCKNFYGDACFYVESLVSPNAYNKVGALALHARTIKFEQKEQDFWGLEVPPTEELFFFLVFIICILLFFLAVNS